MSELLNEDAASGETAELYADIRSQFGTVPAIFRAQAATDPAGARQHWEQVRHIMLRPSALDRKTKELIALAVSKANDCTYCSLAHETLARQAGATPAEIGEVRQIVALFLSLNHIAESLRVPCDMLPPS